MPVEGGLDFGPNPEWIYSVTINITQGIPK